MTQQLTVIRPVMVTPAMVVSTNVTEDDYGAYNPAATYALGDRVIVAADHKVYQSTEASNVGSTPSLLQKWVVVGPTNRYKAFDTSNTTQTARGLLISYRITPGKSITAVAALNLAGASSIRVRVVHPTLGTMYDKTTPLAGQLLFSTWWDWFFGARTEPRQSISVDLPAVPTADILIDIEGTTALAVGVILLGEQRVFGLGVQKGARIGIQDYSRKEKNEFGDTILVERPFARRASFSMLLKATEVDSMYSFLGDVRATPCLWIGSSIYEATTVYGIYKSFDIVLSYRDYSDCELELEGLT